MMLMLVLATFLAVSSKNHGMCSSGISTSSNSSTSAISNHSMQTSLINLTTIMSSANTSLPATNSTPSSSFITTSAGGIFPTSSSSFALSSIATSPTPGLSMRPGFPPAVELTEFGIVLVALGTFLIAFMVVSLLWICCKGRERSPQAPHVTVKMKPWSNRTPDSSAGDLPTEATIATDHPNSFNNSALSSVSANSPPAPARHSRSPKNAVNFRESPLI